MQLRIRNKPEFPVGEKTILDQSTRHFIDMIDIAKGNTIKRKQTVCVCGWGEEFPVPICTLNNVCSEAHHHANMCGKGIL